MIAVSIARYATIAKDWLLLPHGASIGRGYVPVVIAKRGPARSAPREANRRPRASHDGVRDLRSCSPEFEAVVVPIQPYARVFEALRAHEVHAALLIHEGRLTFEREGFAKVCDVGEAWMKLTGLPLPLGGNAIRRGLGEELIARVSPRARVDRRGARSPRRSQDALLAEETRADG